MVGDELATLLRKVRSCTHCDLPHQPRPILRADLQARVLIIGQAPGARVHASGIPWNDASGDRLREWMGIDNETFLGLRVALVPMGFCYPGKGASGDLPPRPECAPLWHPRVLPLLRVVRLTLLVGAYAQQRMLGDSAAASLTDTVRAYADHLPRFFPLPHPSPRNAIWRKRNSWFENTCVPELRSRVKAALR